MPKPRMNRPLVEAAMMMTLIIIQPHNDGHGADEPFLQSPTKKEEKIENNNMQSRFIYLQHLVFCSPFLFFSFIERSYHFVYIQML